MYRTSSDASSMFVPFSKCIDFMLCKLSFGLDMVFPFSMSGIDSTRPLLEPGISSSFFISICLLSFIDEYSPMSIMPLLSELNLVVSSIETPDGRGDTATLQRTVYTQFNIVTFVVVMVFIP